MLIHNFDLFPSNVSLHPMICKNNKNQWISVAVSIVYSDNEYTQIWEESNHWKGRVKSVELSKATETMLYTQLHENEAVITASNIGQMRPYSVQQ